LKKIIFIIIAGLLVLSGCQAQHTVIDPFRSLIDATANLFGGSYGFAIILITIVIRLILSPFMLKQMKQQQVMKDKMEAIKPEMDKIKARMQETKDTAEQRKIQQEMMVLYKEHNMNPLSMGCLPVLIQMPILMVFYYAIRGSHEIASHNFLWFSLGHPNIPLALTAGFIYLLQFRVAQINMPATTQSSMKYIGLISPIMILFISWHAPAVLPLYWSVGGLFLIVQTLYAHRYVINKYQTETAAAKEK
jgi:YidC/Oxa1 family membrane protein insertase